MKRTNLLLILVLALLVSSLPFTALAANDESVVPEEGDISVTIPGGGTVTQVYTVVFVDENDEVLSSQQYSYGDVLVAPVAPEKDDSFTDIMSIFNRK